MRDRLTQALRRPSTADGPKPVGRGDAGDSRATAFGVVMLLICGALLGAASIPLSDAVSPDPASGDSTDIIWGAGSVVIAALALVAGIWASTRRGAVPKYHMFVGVAMLVIAGALFVFTVGAIGIAINPNAIEDNPSLSERVGVPVAFGAITAIPLALGILFLRRR